MSCERAIDLMIDSLVEPLDQAQLDELQRHVAECESCAAELADYRTLWRQMETVAIPEQSLGALERLQTEVRKEFAGEYAAATRDARSPMAFTGSWMQRLAAAIALVGLGAILAIGARDFLGDAGPADETVDTRARYLFIMTETQEGPELAAQAQSEIQAWFAGLAEQGVIESGSGIAVGPPVGTPPDGTLFNGPVSGFMVIRAADSQEARRIAVSSPIIDYGGFIEIRAMDDDDEDQ